MEDTRQRVSPRDLLSRATPFAPKEASWQKVRSGGYEPYTRGPLWKFHYLDGNLRPERVGIPAEEW